MIATVITVVLVVDFASGLPGNRAKANMDEKIQDFEPFNLLGPTKLSISFNTHTHTHKHCICSYGLQQGEFRLSHHHIVESNTAYSSLYQRPLSFNIQNPIGVRIVQSALPP
ncbi:hypothetical protein Peur_036677 [Populus x canadensis]